MKQHGFYNFLLNKNLSENTIKAYMLSSKLFFWSLSKNHKTKSF